LNTVLPPKSDLDVAQIGADSLPEKAFPAGRGFRVCFDPAAHESIWSHARSTLADGDAIKEVVGVLVGDVYRDEGGPFLEIKASIPAEHTRNEGTEVAFTPETWAAINRVKDARFSEERIVGWYHTHPNFGIFLSERDKFVHTTAFPQPWAVAHVVDPVQSLEGVFAWSAGEPRETAEYWVGGEKKLSGAALGAARTAAAAPATREKSEHEGGVSRWTFLLTVVLGSLALIGVSGFFYRNELIWAEEEQLIVQALNSQRQELDRSMQAFELVRKQLEILRQQTKTSDEELDAHLKQLDSGLKRVRDLARSLQKEVQDLVGCIRTHGLPSDLS
jgi:proteasome lid subunit RPN8/RPN11